MVGGGRKRGKGKELEVGRDDEERKGKGGGEYERKKKKREGTVRQERKREARGGVKGGYSPIFKRSGHSAMMEVPVFGYCGPSHATSSN